VKTSKGQIFLFLFLLLITTAAGGLAWKYYIRSTQLAAQLLSPDERASQAKRIADYQAQIKKLQDRLNAMLGRGGDQADVAGNAGGGRRQGRGGNFAAAFQAVMNTPEFQKLQALQIRGSLDARYAALFKSLNLTSDQVAQLKDLLVNKQQAATDAFSAARDQGINPRTDPQDFQAAIQAAQSSVNDQIKSALGDAGYAQYQQYEQTTPQRNVVSQLQQSLSYGSAPLTDDQASQLVQILAQTAPQQGQQGRAAFIGAFGGAAAAPATITDQALTQAQGILSQPQIQALQQIQQQQQAQQQMQQLMRSAIQNANGGGARNGGG
jgi:hypothetical protein